MTAKPNDRHVTVIGAGLAGCEATWQLLKRGIRVTLVEMRPQKMTEAHSTGLFAELVCSNSLRGAALTNAVGLLKAELSELGSLIMNSATLNRVPAGGALAVDRNLFSAYITDTLSNHPLFELEIREAVDIPTASPKHPVIVATGPLTSTAFAQALREKTSSDHLAFYDAISPILSYHSLDLSKMFFQSRYDKGSGSDYLNIPLEKQEYSDFVREILSGDKITPHGEGSTHSEDQPSLKPFEGCMPIEDLCERGEETLRFEYEKVARSR